MAIPVKTELVRRLIRARFDSVDNLIVEWEHRVDTGRLRAGVSRDRATVYRWLSGGVPSKPDDIFGFAGLLDVDPVALLEIDETYIHEQFGRERRFFRLNRPRRTPLSALWALYSAEHGWPDTRIAETWLGGSWHISDFAHDAKGLRNLFAGIAITPESADQTQPRTFHFAWRPVEASDAMWRPFGTVVAVDDDVTMFSERGVFDRATRNGQTVHVDLWFGQGPAAFRVASIHPFALECEVPSKGLPCVRFPA